MMTPFAGSIQLFAFKYAPMGWAPCNGQLLAIANFTVLYTLLGTTYGGDGKTTFAAERGWSGLLHLHRGRAAAAGLKADLALMRGRTSGTSKRCDEGGCAFAA
jgi:microcystin-dependent protein